MLESGKFQMLDSLLPEMKVRGDRVLLFSQFTMLLDIAEEYLRIRNHSYLRLDGSTLVSNRYLVIIVAFVYWLQMQHFHEYPLNSVTLD